jgi:hypothetical protein
MNAMRGKSSPYSSALKCIHTSIRTRIQSCRLNLCVFFVFGIYSTLRCVPPARTIVAVPLSFQVAMKQQDKICW